jgi:opacity protein-like surface antigen
MKNISELFLLLSLSAPAAMAQSPRASAIGPSVNASLGYSFTSQTVPASSRIQLNGLDATFTVDVISRLGARLDVGYVRAANVLNSGYDRDVLSYLSGPVFYVVRDPKRALFAQGLLGAARVTGPVPLSGGQFQNGYVNQFAWAIGGGAQYRIRESIGIRVGADYLHTRYFTSSTAISGQGNLRITASFVYFFGRRRTRN